MVPNLTNPGIKTFTAGGSITKGNPVKLSSGNVVATSAAADLAIGIAMDGASSGDTVPVALLGNCPGTLRLRAGGAISAGAQVAANATATAAATDAIIGIALEAASASGDEIEIVHQLAQVK